MCRKFNLNTPYELNTEVAEEPLSDVELQERLNRMWRNECINDTYEPGSTFKIITSSACLEEGVVSLSDTIFLPRIPGGGRPQDSVPQGGRTWAGNFYTGDSEFL